MFGEMSDICVEKNITMKMILEALQGYDVPPTPEGIKEVWKAIQYTMYKTDSTTKLETHQLDKVYEVLNLLLGEEFAVHVGFPCRDSEAFEQLTEEHA